MVSTHTWSLVVYGIGILAAASVIADAFDKKIPGKREALGMAVVVVVIALSSFGIGKLIEFGGEQITTEEEAKATEKADIRLASSVILGAEVAEFNYGYNGKLESISVVVKDEMCSVTVGLRAIKHSDGKYIFSTTSGTGAVDGDIMDDPEELREKGCGVR